MDELKSKVPGCFGSTDLKFAGHPTEIERAREVLKIAMENHLSFFNFMMLFQNYLESKGADKGHIKRQLNKVAKVESYFIS